MKRTLLITSLILAATVFAAAQNTSIYTSTRTSSCRTIKSSDEGAGSYLGECRGVGGYKIRVLEDDIRQTIDVVTPANKKFALDFWAFYSGFSAVGEKIEWRMKGGVPVALIARFNVSDPEDYKKTTSYLMVAKVGKTSSCVTDVVEPAAGQNETARKLADAASTKPCKSKE